LIGHAASLVISETIERNVLHCCPRRVGVSDKVLQGKLLDMALADVGRAPAASSFSKAVSGMCTFAKSDPGEC